jgi:hypothetical protein
MILSIPAYLRRTCGGEFYFQKAGSAAVFQNSAQSKRWRREFRGHDGGMTDRDPGRSLGARRQNRADRRSYLLPRAGSMLFILRARANGGIKRTQTSQPPRYAFPARPLYSGSRTALNPDRPNALRNSGLRRAQTDARRMLRSWRIDSRQGVFGASLYRKRPANPPARFARRLRSDRKKPRSELLRLARCCPSLLGSGKLKGWAALSRFPVASRDCVTQVLNQLKPTPATHAASE